MKQIVLRNGTTANLHSVNYSTTQENFQILEHNRGKKMGYDLQRVNNLMELILSPMFIWLLSTIKVIYRESTKSLIVVDGANRVTAVRELIKEGKLPKDYQIPFTIVNNPILEKMKNTDLIDFMSIINEYDPRWTESQHFNAACSSNLKTALMFEKYLTLYQSKENINRVKYSCGNTTKVVALKPNVLLSLATRKELKSAIVTYKSYRDEFIGNYMETPEFEKNFNALIDFIEIAKEWHVSKNIRVSKSLTAALSLAFNENHSFSLSYMVYKLNKTKKIPTSDKGLKNFLANIMI